MLCHRLSVLQKFLDPKDKEAFDDAQKLLALLSARVSRSELWQLKLFERHLWFYLSLHLLEVLVEGITRLFWLPIVPTYKVLPVFLEVLGIAQPRTFSFCHLQILLTVRTILIIKLIDTS